MKITKQARRDAKQLFNTCKVGGLLDEARVRQVVGVVVAQKPRGYAGILTHFQRKGQQLLQAVRLVSVALQLQLALMRLSRLRSERLVNNGVYS